LAFKVDRLIPGAKLPPQNDSNILLRNRKAVFLVLIGIFVIFSPHMLIHNVFGATYQPPSNLNTYPAPAVPSWLDTGSNAWMLTAATLVGLMSLPGLAIFYGGLAKKRFILNTLFMIFYAYAAVLIVWLLFGYNLGFGPAGVKIGNYGILGMPTPTLSAGFMSSQATIGPTGFPINIPMSTIVFFQFVFAAITPGLFAGAIIERMSFKAWMIFVPVWSALVYSPLSYWLFAGGWLNQMGAVDFSGGYVIHLSAGITALAAALAVGPRLSSDRRSKPNNVILVFIGAGILWLGWNGFNGGDPYGATIDAAIAVLNTELAAAASVIAWMLMDMKFKHKPTLIGATTAAVTGLVAITPAAGYVNGYGALLIGIAAGTIPWIATNNLAPKLKLDDALGVFPAHGVAGLTGGLLTGILADPAVTQFVAPGLTGALYGNLNELGVQAFAAGVVVVYVFVVTFVLLKLIGLLTPLREKDATLKVGDMAIHGEIGIDMED
jgi:Amt family ammonium transporter